MQLHRTAWDDPVVRRLTGDQQAGIRARYGGQEEPGAHPSAPDASTV